MPSFLGVVSIAVALLVLTSFTASAASARKGKVSVVRVPVDDYLRRTESEYAARAHSRDPAGDYKAYPNWARAALGATGRAGGGR